MVILQYKECGSTGLALFNDYSLCRQQGRSRYFRMVLVQGMDEGWMNEALDRHGVGGHREV